MYYQNPNNRPVQAPANDHVYVNGYGFVEQDPRIKENRGIRRHAIIVGFLLILILVLSTVGIYPVTLVLSSFLSILPITDTYSASTAFLELRELFVYTFSLLVPLVIAWALLRGPRRDRLFVPPAKGIPVISILFTLGVWVLLTLVTDLVADIFSRFHIVELTPDYLLPLTPAALILYMIRLAILPAILEELLFRGILLRAFRQYGDAFALVASSFAFGLIHYSFTKDVSGFVLGLVLGYFVLRSGSVATAILSRFFILFVPLAMRLLQHILPVSTYRITEYCLYIVLLIAAIALFVWTCRKGSNAFILSSGNSSTRISLKLRIFLFNIPMLIAVILWGIQMIDHIQFIG